MSNSAQTQCSKILDWLLLHKSLTTFQSRQELDIMHPSARVQELKAQGHNIITERTTEDCGKGKHRIAKYVLLMGAANE